MDLDGPASTLQLVLWAFGIVEFIVICCVAVYQTSNEQDADSHSSTMSGNN